jgi:Leucine-rich repeat (LRR) protein
MNIEQLRDWWKMLTKVERAILTINYHLWQINYKEGTGYLKFDRIDAQKSNWDSPWSHNRSLESYNVKGWLIRWDSPWAAYQSHYGFPFDVDNFSSPPLAELALLPKLNISCKNSPYNINSLRLVKGFSQLSELRCNGCELYNFDGIENLKELTLLEASNNKIKNLSPLSQCENLEWLNIDNNDIEDLHPLRSCYKLKILYINRNKLTNLTPLAQLPNLHSIYCQHNEIKDVTTLSNMTLECFDYTNNPVEPFIPPSAPHIGPHLQNWHSLLTVWWKKLDPLQRQILGVNLEFLNNKKTLPNAYPYNVFAHYKAVFRSEFNPDYLLKIKVSSLLKLSYLNISLAPFTGLNKEKPQLTSLDFIAPLLFSLHALVCDFNQISDFSALARAKSLRILHCDCNPISANIAQIAQIPNLEILHCNDANIVSIASLRYLTTLKTLYALDNPISIEELEYLQTYLPHCKIYI